MKLKSILSLIALSTGCAGADETATETKSADITTSERISIDSSGAITCTVHGDGTVGCSGIQGATLSGATQVATSGRHVCALKAEGTVYCWGNNFDGDLGAVTPEGPADPKYGSRPISSVAPLQVLGLKDVSKITKSCALAADGSVSCWGNRLAGITDGRARTAEELAPIQVPQFGTNAVDIAQESHKVCAIMGDGTIKCVLYDFINGGYRGSDSPFATNDLCRIVMDGRTACALKKDGSVWCAGGGWDPYKIEGISGNVVQLALASDLVGYGSYMSAVCARTDKNKLFCNSPYREDGFANARPVDVEGVVQIGSGPTAYAVTSGGQHGSLRIDQTGYYSMWFREAFLP
jgi:Regulator of chromosome condensation (RCC1) repeat